MHVRSAHYMGVAPLPDGLTNACLVVPHEQGTPGWRDSSALLMSYLRSDERLAPRFAHARMVDRPTVLGPMAVDASSPGMPGLLLAGDAAGFIDPITGDGMTFALRGAVMAGEVAIDVLTGVLDTRIASSVLARRRRRSFAAKWRFNRAVRRLVASPAAISTVAGLTQIWPGLARSMMRYAGDVER